MKLRPPPGGEVGGRESSHRAGHDRAVSEVVSFILTFSMITMMVGVLFTAGIVSLDQLQTGNQMQNAEGVFFAMSDSFTELQEGQAPKRAGSLDLDVGASVTVVNDSSIDIVVHNSTGAVAFTRSLPVRSLQYRLGQRSVTYETGAVLRSNEGRSAMVGEPQGLLCSNESNMAVVSVVTLVAPDGGSVASGTATVTGFQRSSTLLYPTDPSRESRAKNVTVDVTSSHGTPWERYLNESGWTDQDDGSFTCSDVDQVFVRSTLIEVQITG